MRTQGSVDHCAAICQRCEHWQWGDVCGQWQGHWRRPDIYSRPNVFHSESSCPIGKWGPEHHEANFPPEPVPPRSSERAVVVVVANREAAEQFAFTGPRMEAYARRCGADFRVIRGNHCRGWPMANKWRAAAFFAEYDRTLYLDVDVIVSPDAPDIFAEVPEHRIAVFDEYDDTKDNLAHDWIQEESDQVSDLVGWPRMRRTWLLNGGVMLFPRWAAGLYGPPPGKFRRIWCLDQTLLTMHLDRFGIRPHLLDQKWNHGFIADNFWQDAPAAHFVHLNGSRPHEYRMWLLDRMCRGNWDRADPPTNAGWIPRWARS